MKNLLAVIAAILLVADCSSKGESPEVVETAEVTGIAQEFINVDVTLSDRESYEMVTIYADTTYCIHVTNAGGMGACQTTDTELMEITPSSDNTLEVKPLKNGDGNITISDTEGNSCVVTLFIRIQQEE